jgi:hypothetical protein
MIETVFEALKQAGVVNSGSDFSEDWLGMEASYYRAVRTKHRVASPKALATCAVRLKTRASALNASTFPTLRAQAMRYAELADHCVDELLAACDVGGQGSAC